MTTLLKQMETEVRTPLVLSDYIKIKHGYAFKGENFSTSPTPDVLVTPGNFAIGGGFKADKLKYHKGPVPEDYILKENDLVVTMTDLSVDADTLGYSALIPADKTSRFLHNQRVGLVQKKKEGIDFGYLNYLMHTRAYQKYVVSTASGSTVKHTSPDRIAGYEYSFPSLETQKKIAEILSAYDAKIDNNNFIAKNLELMGRSIFNKWFIKSSLDSDIENESEIVLSEILDINPTTQIGENGARHTDMKDLSESMMYFSSDDIKVTRSGGSRFKNHDTLLARITPCLENGKTGYVNCLDKDEVATGSTEFLVLRPKAKEYREFIYFLARDEQFRNFAIGRMVGSSGRQRVTGDDIARFKLAQPDNDLILKFHTIFEPVFENIKVISEENKRLRTVRDRLLTKLI